MKQRKAVDLWAEGQPSFASARSGDSALIGERGARCLGVLLALVVAWHPASAAVLFSDCFNRAVAGQCEDSHSAPPSVFPVSNFSLDLADNAFGGSGCQFTETQSSFVTDEWSNRPELGRVSTWLPR